MPEWVDLTQRADEDFTPVPWEDNLTYWEAAEPPDQQRAALPLTTGPTTATWPSSASPMGARSSPTSGCAPS